MAINFPNSPTVGDTHTHLGLEWTCTRSSGTDVRWAKTGDDIFQSKYLGAFSSEPTLDNSGNLLTAGLVFFNTTNNEIGFYNGTFWEYPALEAANSASAASTSETNAATSASQALAASSFLYTFSNSTTMADPGTGVLRFDNATISSVTNIAFDASSADTGNPDISDFIATFDDSTNTTTAGHLIIRKVGTPEFFAIFSITGSVTDNTDWLQLGVTYVTGNSTLSDADDLVIVYSRAGDQGGGLTDIVNDTTPQLGGDLNANGNQVQLSKGADVASAATLPILTDGNYFDVTGTNTITAIASTGGIGTQIKLHFDSALTLTHHATDLILPGGANITTAAGDEAEFVEYASGDWRCTSYTVAATAPGGGGIGKFIDTSIAISSDDTALANDDATANNNIGIGLNAGYTITTALDSIAIGKDSLYGTTSLTGARNIGIGVQSGYSLTSGGYNFFVGQEAGYYDTTGGYNIGIGYQAAYGDSTSKLTGSHNVCVGRHTGRGLTTGTDNVAIGYQAGYNLSSDKYAVLIGYNAGYSIDGGSSGTSSICLGYNAGYSITTGENNICIGYGSGDAMTTAHGNVFIGQNAGTAFNSAANNNVFIGRSAGDAKTGGQNCTVIGYDADSSTTTVSNEFTLGNSSITTLRCQQTSITALSDKRDKANINDISTGLDFINDLRPVNFQWDKRENYPDGIRDGSKIEDTIQSGFIVQEVQEAVTKHGGDLQDLILQTNPEKLELKQGDLLPSAIRAIQELSEQVKQLKQELQELKNG